VLHPEILLHPVNFPDPDPGLGLDRLRSAKIVIPGNSPCASPCNSGGKMAFFRNGGPFSDFFKGRQG